MAERPRDPAPPDPRRRLFSAACERNKGPILEVLERVLPAAGVVLEIGAGTGQHAAHFAPRLPALVWQPTDPDPEMRTSIDAWAAEAGAANLEPALDLDVTATDWPVGRAAAVFSANMIHIAPWACCLGLMAGAGRVLTARGAEGGTPDRDQARGAEGGTPDRDQARGAEGGTPDRDQARGAEGGTPDRDQAKGGILVLYGPFKIGGRHTAPSNASFDDSLKAQDPAWGVRGLDEVAEAALAQGLRIAETVKMPVNNMIAVFRKEG